MAFCTLTYPCSHAYHYIVHDEAATHYIDMIDQTTLGHRLLKDSFGDDGIVTVGWQLDPFGHSATQAALLSAPEVCEATAVSTSDDRSASVALGTDHLRRPRLPLPLCHTPHRLSYLESAYLSQNHFHHILYRYRNATDGYDEGL